MMKATIAQSELWSMGRNLSLSGSLGGMIGSMYVIDGTLAESTLPLWITLIVMGGVGFKLTGRAYAMCSKREERLRMEYRIAVKEVAILGTKELQESHARKWFISVCRTERAIRREYQRRHADPSWVDFLEKQGHVGHIVLEWYAQDMRLLKLAKEFNTCPFGEYAEARARETLRLTRTKMLGEAEIEAEQERLRGTEKKPWEDVL